MEERRRSGTGWCSAVNCSNNRKQEQKRSFFKFPLDPDRCKKWVIACRRADLIDKSTGYLHMNCKICSDHFEDVMFLNDIKNRLHKHAVPTIFDVPNPPPLVQSRRKPPKKRILQDCQDFGIIKKHRSVLVHPNENTAIENACVDWSERELQAAESLVNLIHATEMKAPDQESTQFAELSSVPAVKPVVLSRPGFSPRKQKLRQLASKWRSRSARLKEKLQLASFAKEPLCRCDINFSPKLKKFMSLFHKPKGAKYSRELQTFALSIHFSSPKTYKLLCRYLPLPSVRFLQRKVAEVPIQEGSTDWIMQVLEKKANEMSQLDKNCIVCFDEIALKKHLHYNAARDHVVGFSQNTPDGTPTVATSALVFMAKGLFRNWKQPLTYHFVGDSCPAQKVREILCELITQLQKKSFVVQAVVSDMGSNFFQMVRSLGLTPEKPYFEVQAQKIHFLFDTSHLIKSFRNNLLVNVFVFGNKVASWKYIEEMYLKDKKRTHRLAPKLTDSHIYLNGFSKMRVKLASQVLSHTCAAAINAHVALGELPAAAAGTAEVIEKFDKIFDCVNSSSLVSEKKYRCAISDKSEHKQYILEFLDFLNELKVKNKAGKDVTKIVKCLFGWKLTLRSILSLWAHLKLDKNVKFLLTRRLNTDALENYFCCVRQQGGNNDNPTPYLFSLAFKKLMMQVELHESSTSNCMWDQDISVVNAEDLAKKVVEDSTSKNDAVEVVAAQGQDYRHLSIPEQNGIVYISGYVINKTLCHHSCEVCQNYAKSSEIMLDPSQVFCHLKAYPSNKQDFGGLAMPNEEFISFLYRLDEIFEKHFMKQIVCQGVGQFILSKFMSDEFVHPCPLFPKMFAMKLFLRMKIYHSIKHHNRDILSAAVQKRRKNKKALKILHK